MPSLRGFTRRLTHGDDDDLVQDTLTSAWHARARLEPGSNFKAWLFRIARNSFLNGLRRSARNVQWDPDLHDRLLVSPPTQEEGLYLNEFDQALEDLPPAQREALLLVAGEGLSYADAACRTGQQPGTMKSRVSRARSAVIALLDEGAASAPRELAITDPIPVEDGSPELPSVYERWKASGSRTIG